MFEIVKTFVKKKLTNPPSGLLDPEVKIPIMDNIGMILVVKREK